LGEVNLGLTTLLAADTPYAKVPKLADCRRSPVVQTPRAARRFFSLSMAQGVNGLRHRSF